MTVLDFDAAKALVSANNRSTILSDEVIICLMWKESGFDTAARNATTSAIGLMQLTTPAVQDVNANTPVGIHYDHGNMTDGAQNIQCGTYYLDLRIRRAGGNVVAGMDGFGTGPGYADNILACETCMKNQPAPQSDEQLKACLYAIHR